MIAMGWLIAIVVLIAAIVFPGVRKVLLAVIAIAALGLLVLYLNSEREEAASTSRVKASEVEISDLRLGRAQYGSSYQLTGRVRNLSPRFTVTSLRLRVLLQDCLAANDCSTVGDSTAYVSLSVPPSQTRAIDDSVHSSDVPPLRGTFRWSDELSEIQAK
jgi:hypothetical protein